MNELYMNVVATFQRGFYVTFSLRRRPYAIVTLHDFDARNKLWILDILYVSIILEKKTKKKKTQTNKQATMTLAYVKYDSVK